MDYVYIALWGLFTPTIFRFLWRQFDSCREPLCLVMGGHWWLSLGYVELDDCIEVWRSCVLCHRCECEIILRCNEV